MRMKIWLSPTIRGPMCCWEMLNFAYLTIFYFFDVARHLWSNLQTCKLFWGGKRFSFNIFGNFFIFWKQKVLRITKKLFSRVLDFFSDQSLKKIISFPILKYCSQVSWQKCALTVKILCLLHQTSPLIKTWYMIYEILMCKLE